MRLQSEPWRLQEFIQPTTILVVIDEIQRLPELLNEVHRLIEQTSVKFLLTGSSARKLRHKGVNLLAGRAWQAELFPLIYREIPQFDLDKHLLHGGLPAVYLGKQPREELYAYVDTYLREEIQAEAFVRKLPAYARFLKAAALTSGQLLNFSKIASDIGVSPSTVREYYQILGDTLLGFVLPAWVKTQKRKATSTAKFYLFDLGVRHTLLNIEHLPVQSDLYGIAFEHFIALELRAYLSYQRIRQSLCYWRSRHGYEVDFIIGDDIAIEVKASHKISQKHIKNLTLLVEENICQRYILVSCDAHIKAVGDVENMHWQQFLEQLWDGKIISS